MRNSRKINNLKEFLTDLDNRTFLSLLILAGVVFTIGLIAGLRYVLMLLIYNT